MSKDEVDSQILDPLVSMIEDLVEEAPNNPLNEAPFGRRHETWVEVIQDAPRDGTIYGRQDGTWVDAGGGAAVDYGIGLQLADPDPTIPGDKPDVNLQPAGSFPELLGGVYVPNRDATKTGLIVTPSDLLAGELTAPPSTDLLLGTITEPPPDGIAHSRQWDFVNSKWIWVPALTAGLQITGLIPDTVLIGPTEPDKLIRAIGQEFTATCKLFADGVEIVSSAYVSPTEMTFMSTPSQELATRTLAITVQDLGTTPVTIGAGAEAFNYVAVSEGLYRGRWQPATNNPDLGTLVKEIEWMWTADIVDPNVPELAPAALPGIGGLTINEGDHIVWDGTTFILITGGGLADYGIGLSKDTTQTPPLVNLQPAGDSPATLGGVYVIDRVRNNTEGLELGLDGRLRAPLATDSLAGTIVEPPPDDKGYVRRRDLAGVSQWVPPADTPGYDYGLGLSVDRTPVPPDQPIVNLTPAGVAPQFLGGVYVPTRDATQAADVDTNGGDGRLVVLTATDTLLGGHLEPPKDGLPYERVWNETAQVWEWQLAAVGPDFGIGLSLDDTTDPDIVHLQPAADSPAGLGGVYVVERTRTHLQGLELNGDGELKAPLATDLLAGSIVEPPPDDKGYVRRRDLAGVSAWVPPADTPLPDFGTGLSHDETTLPGIVHLQPAADSPAGLGGIYVVDRTRTEIQGLELNGDGELKAPLATDLLAGSIIEPPPDDKGYVRRRDLAGVSAWVPPADTPLPDFGIGLSLDDTTDPNIVHLQPAADSPAGLGGIYVVDRTRTEIQGLELNGDGELKAPLATDLLAGSIIEPPPDDKGYVRRRTVAGESAWVPPAGAPLTDYGTGLSLDETQTPQIVHLQPAGPVASLLGGVWVSPRTDVQALELDVSAAATGEIKVPLATDLLAGAHTEPLPNGIAHTRQYDVATSKWIWTPALTAGLTITGILPDKAIFGPTEPLLTVHAYGTDFTATCVIMVDGVDTATTFVSATELTFVMNPAVPIAEQSHIITVKDTAPVPPATGVGAGAEGFDFIVASTQVDYGTGLSFDTATTPPIVHLQPAGWTPALLGGVYTTGGRSATEGLDLSITGSGQVSVPLATDTLAGSIVEPPPDDLKYVRTRTAAGVSSWVESTAVGTDYGTGLSYDDTVTPPIVNLQPAGWAPNLLGGVYGEMRSATNGLDLSITGNGFITAPLATDALAGTHTEPPQDGIAHTRQWDVVTSKWIWTPALTAGLTITGLIPNKVQIPSTVPLTVHVYGAEFTATTEVLLDGVPVAPVATFVSSTEMTFTIDPTPETIARTVIVTVREGATVGAGAEAFDFTLAVMGGVIIADAPPDPLTTPPNTLWWESDTGDLYVLYDDGNSIQWVEAVAGAEPGIMIHVGDVAPDPMACNPKDLWWDSDSGSLSIYYQDVDSTQWVQILGSGGALTAAVQVSDAPPANPTNGMLWYDSDLGELFAYIDDGNSLQWVQVSSEPSTAAGAICSDVPPVNPVDNLLWWNTVDSVLYVYYNDGTSTQWVQTSIEEAPIDGTPYIRQNGDWIPNLVIATGTVGDVKTGFQAADHGGWILLDGRAVSTLTATQQANAALFGFAANLPNGDKSSVRMDAALVPGAVSGSPKITQANLPAINTANSAVLTSSGHDAAAVNTNSAGAHAHTMSYATNNNDATDWGSVAYPGKVWQGNNATTDNGNLDGNAVLMDSGGAHTHTVDMPNHTHTIPAHAHSLGGGGTDYFDKAVIVNMFVYLGP